MDRFVAELAIVGDAVGLDEVHLVGHSWGAMLLASYLATGPAGVRTATFSSPCLDAHQRDADQQAHLGSLPPEVRATIERCERDGTTQSEEYQAAMLAFFQRHMWRKNRQPDLSARMRAGLNRAVYAHTWGSSEWRVTGTLADFDARPWLADLPQPLLFTCGEHDEARPETVRNHAALARDARVHVFEGAAHLAHLEAPPTSTDRSCRSSSERTPPDRRSPAAGWIGSALTRGWLCRDRWATPPGMAWAQESREGRLTVRSSEKRHRHWASSIPFRHHNCYPAVAMPDFEYDPAKSAANLAKHGIDFVAGQALWSDDAAIEAPARTEGEPRFLVVGRIGQTPWAAIITYRGQTIRIISIRRARQEEVARYEGN